MSTASRRSRKGGRTKKKKEGNLNEGEEEKGGDSKDVQPLWTRLLLILVWSFPIYLSIGAYQQWGLYFFVPLFLRDLRYSPEQWQEILHNHTVILLGGPHRGGTTVLWDTFRQHPMISDFGNQRESGLDFSEGIFTQDVYPRFSIGFESSRRPKEPVGLGRFALANEKHVHWTHEHPKITPSNQARLLNRYGWYWDLNKRFLLEKSPTNAVLSTFLQSLINLGNDGWLPVAPGFGGGRSVVKFIFISRHPWANSYAHLKMEGVADQMEILLSNWLKVHEYMEADASMLQYVKVVKLEDFEKDPRSMVIKLWKWIGLSGDFEAYAESAAKDVRPNQNAKYVSRHCNLLQGPAALEHFKRIVETFNARVKALKLVRYDLNSTVWNCQSTQR